MKNKPRSAFPAIRAALPIGKGESNPDFAHVQSFLERFGYLKPHAYRDGTLDTVTSDALRHYQRNNGRRPLGTFNKVTRTQMTTHRCGMPDFESGLAFAAACPWTKRRVTFTFDTGTSDLNNAVAFGAVRRAFATWDAAVAITLQEVGPGDDPDIVVGWRTIPDPDFDLTGPTLAHADFPPGCSVVTAQPPLPIHFDDSEHRWVIGSVPGAFDVESVALHEIGHTLGLRHSSVAGAVMFSSIGPGTINRTLHPDDLAGIAALYP